MDFHVPDYILPFNNNRLRSSHLDQRCFTSSINPSNQTSTRNFETVSNRGFNNSFFYRTHLAWNRLPLSLREIVCPGKFKVALLEHLWKDGIMAEYMRCMDENGVHPDVHSETDIDDDFG